MRATTRPDSPIEVLYNEREWRRWIKRVAGADWKEEKPPLEYPCLAFATVRSFGYEEEQPHYLYSDDLRDYLENWLVTK